MGISTARVTAIQISLVLLAFVSSVQAQTPQLSPATQPTAILEGRVYSADDKPIAGARIGLYDSSQRIEGRTPSIVDRGYPRLASGVTDAQGNFRIAVKAVNYVTVVAQADGFGICLFPAPLHAMDDPLSIQLSPATSVVAHVVAPDGTPAPGIRIGPRLISNSLNGTSAWFPDELRDQLSQVSSAAGECTFNGMPRGATISFEVTDERYIHTGAIQAALTTDPPRDAGPIHIQPAGIIEGRVLLGDSGAPAAGMLVFSNAAFDTTTDAEGRYRLTRVRPGEVMLLPRPRDPLSSQYIGEIANVTVAGGQTIRGKDLVLVPGTAIHGKTTTQDGLPVAGARVTVTPTPPGPLDNTLSFEPLSAVSRMDGTYEIRVLPGRYQLRVAPPAAVNLVPPRENRVEVAVASGQPVSADFVLPGGSEPFVGMVKGVVVDELARPIEDAEILCHVSEPSARGPQFGTGIPPVTTLYTASSADGKFELLANGPRATLMSRKGEMTLGSPIGVRPGSAEPRLVLKRTAGILVMRAEQINGTPIAGAAVAIQVDPGRQLAPRWGLTKTDGTFTLAPVFAERSYFVSIRAPGYADREANFGIPSSEDGMLLPNGAAGWVTLEPGRTLETPIKLYKTDSSLAGMVVDASGAGLANVSVQVHGRLSGDRIGRTDSSGSFRIDQLVAEDLLSVTTISSGSRSGQTTVRSGTQDAKIVHAAAAGGGPARGAR